MNKRKLPTKTGALVLTIGLLLGTVTACSALCQSEETRETAASTTAQTSKTATVSIPMQAQAKNQDTTPSETSSEAQEGEELVVHYIDVGQGDSILIQQGTHAMLIDAGSNDAGKTVVAYLQGLGVTSIDILIGTHPHEDHIGGLDDVIQNFTIGKVILPDIMSTTQTFEDVLLAIQDKGLSITKAVAGTNYELGQAKIQIVGPITIDETDLNSASVVCRVTFGDTSFLFTGDAGASSEQQMIAAGYELDADVIKQPHHGSSTSYSAAFALLVHPKYSVISVGAGNMYNHPHAETLLKLANAGVSVFRTDLSGTIIATSDGQSITFNVAPNAGSAPTNNGSEPSEESDATPAETAQAGTQAVTEPSDTAAATMYIGNTKSKIFHLPTCASLPAEHNQILFKDRQEAIDDGYRPCGNCNP